MNLASKLTRAGKDGFTFSNKVQPPDEEENIKNQKTLNDALRDHPLIRTYQEKIEPELNRGAERENLSKEDFLLAKTAELYLVWHFEKIYGSIYGSQINALQFLNSHGLNAPKTAIKVFYDNAKANYSLPYEKYEFEQWLWYMQAQSLIFIDGDKVDITQEGQGFLNYIFNHHILNKIY